MGKRVCGYTVELNPRTCARLATWCTSSEPVRRWLRA